jgi:RNA polymerase sigma-70 factor (ECF subfamily)
MPIPDAALWEAIQARADATAFATLYERYWRRLFTAAYARLPDREACEEIVHDIFLTLWTERARLHIQVFPAYLGAAVRYQAARHQRTLSTSPLRYADALDTLSTAADYNHGETQLLGLDLEQRLAAALSQLPQRCQEIFLLSRMQHFSNDEIAARLHISRRSVENQLTTALRHLRLTLKCLMIFWLLSYC